MNSKGTINTLGTAHTGTLREHRAGIITVAVLVTALAVTARLTSLAVMRSALAFLTVPAIAVLVLIETTERIESRHGSNSDAMLNLIVGIITQLTATACFIGVVYLYTVMDTVTPAVTGAMIAVHLVAEYWASTVLTRAVQAVQALRVPQRG